MFTCLISNFVKAQLKNRLSIQTMITTFIIVIILSIISSYIQIFYENLKNKKDLIENLESIEKTISQPLADAIWECNDEKIGEFLIQIKKNHFVSYAELTQFDRNDLSYDVLPIGSKAQLKNKNSILHSFNLISHGNEVGYIEIISNPNYLISRIQSKIPLIIILNIFLAIVISICLMLLINSIIIKHLSFIAQKASDVSLENINDKLELPNREEDFLRNELDDLILAINHMKKTISEEMENNNKTNTKLKSERDFSNTLLNSCSLVICKLDSDFNIIDINSATTLMTGYLDFEIHGKKWLDIFVDENQHEEMKNKITTSIYCNIKDVSTRDQNGNTLYMEWYFVPVFEENELKYHIAFGYDITKLKVAQQELEIANQELESKIENRTKELRQTNKELKQAYEELQTTQKQLIESETMASLGSLVAGIAHEINTPLGVSVTAQTLIEDQLIQLKKLYEKDDINIKKILNCISVMNEANIILNSNLKQASKLIKSFKQVAVDSSSQNLYQFNMNENLNQTLISLSNVIKKERLTIDVNCDPTYVINSYPGALTQIYTNLIMNTVLHAYENIQQDGTFKKRISISIEKQDNNDMLIKYEDNGSGIAKDILPKIFEPFITSKRGKGGSGLGANIIYNLVIKVLLGKISCENLKSPLHGAKFTLQIPNLTNSLENSKE